MDATTVAIQKVPLTPGGKTAKRRSTRSPVGSFEIVVGLFQLPDPIGRFVTFGPQFFNLGLQLAPHRVVLPT